MRKKGRTCISWEINDNGAWHSICDAVVVRVIARSKNNIYDFALTTIHEAVFYS